MNVEHLVEYEVRGGNELLGEKTSQYNFVHHKSRMT
jgi:hypothetical protein